MPTAQFSHRRQRASSRERGCQVVVRGGMQLLYAPQPEGPLAQWDSAMAQVGARRATLAELAALA